MTTALLVLGGGAVGALIVHVAFRLLDRFVWMPYAYPWTRFPIGRRVLITQRLRDQATRQPTGDFVEVVGDVVDHQGGLLLVGEWVGPAYLTFYRSVSDPDLKIELLPPVERMPGDPALAWIEARHLKETVR